MFWLLVILLPLMVGCTYRGVKDPEMVRSINLEVDMASLASCSELPSHPLTLEELVAIAIESNLELMVKQQDVAVQHEIATGQKLQMLPSLLISSELSQRNNGPGSASASLIPSIPPAPPSVSSQRSVFRWDATVTWNLLDFGVSYFRYRQEVNKTLIHALEYRRQEQNIIYDVAQAYWKAVAMRRTLDAAAPLEEKITRHGELLEKYISRQLLPLIQGNKDRSRLFAMSGTIQGFQKDYDRAIYELKNKAGIAPAVDIQLFIPEVVDYEVPYGVDELAHYALLNRPELYSGDFEEAVHLDEVRAAMLQLLPGVSLFGSEFYDRNIFLLNNNWLIAGIRAGWNLLSIPQHIQEADIAKARGKMTRLTRISLSMGVLSQVYLSWILYRDVKEEFQVSYQASLIDKELLEAAQRENELGMIHDGELLGYEMASLDSEVRVFKLYAELQSTLEQLNNAIGIPLFLNTGGIHCAPVYATPLVRNCPAP